MSSTLRYLITTGGVNLAWARGHSPREHLPNVLLVRNLELPQVRHEEIHLIISIISISKDARRTSQLGLDHEDKTKPRLYHIHPLSPASIALLHPSILHKPTLKDSPSTITPRSHNKHDRDLHKARHHYLMCVTSSTLRSPPKLLNNHIVTTGIPACQHSIETRQ